MLGKVCQLLSTSYFPKKNTNKNIAINRPAAETDLVEANDIFACNVLGVININQTFLPELLAAKGTIVNIGSVAGHIPLPFNAVYCASKAALYAYSECLRVELAPFDIKVTYIQTGNVKTNIIRERTHLDDHSLWAPISESFEKRQEIAATTGDEPKVFAENLVGRLLSGHKNVHWVGNSAFVVRMVIALDQWLPFQLLSSMFSHIYNMEKIKAR
jgi:1-acylglycerone phosphate reductase